MLIVRFLGKVLPSVLPLTFTGLPGLKVGSDAATGLEMILTVSIVNSDVDVVIQVNKWEEGCMDLVHARAFELCATYLGIYHFATGDAHLVHFDRFIAPNGKITFLVNRNPSLAQFCTFVKFPPTTPAEMMGFGNSLRALLGERELSYALHDLMQASMIPNQAITNCARVLDGFRIIAARGLDPKRGWPLLRSIINVDEAYLQMMFDYAKKTRHGDRSFVSGVIVTEILHRTHNVMNRFIEYRIRGSQKLPLDEFPLLKG